ncbi:hypothetical protein [Sphingomonas humi]|uniref:Transglutaminase-like domain-containing protein n=1 Tax=Sphingomonas humi TaxID=335630 RepID=A0ABP7SCX8_9SPHN
MLGLLLACLSAAAAVTEVPRSRIPAVKEQFDPFLAGLDSVDEIMLVLDTAYPHATALQKLDAADALLRRRFIHSYSYFRFDQNWLAASLRPIWADLASPVLPDDILLHRRAACSQQALVFLEVSRRLGFDYAAVGAPGHFMSGVKIDGRWWVYDADQEVSVRRYPFAWLQRGDPRLDGVYEPTGARLLHAAAHAGKVKLSSINRFAAPQARLLHQVTALVSDFGWFVVLMAWALLSLTVVQRRTEPSAAFVPA